MDPRPLQGRLVLSRLLGRRVRGIERWIMDLGGANDEFGHGVTLFHLDDGFVTFRPGPNEDFIIVEEGAPGRSAFHPNHWTFVDLSAQGLWTPPQGEIDRVELFTDGVDDVAILVHFTSGEQVVTALVNTDLVMASDLAVFGPDIVPWLRETLRLES